MSARLPVSGLRSLYVLTSLVAVGVVAHAEADKPLRVCLPEDSGPYSSVERNRGAGMDHDLMGAVAVRLGRGFEPLWFESRFDKDRIESGGELLSRGERCWLPASVTW